MKPEDTANFSPSGRPWRSREEEEETADLMGHPAELERVINEAARDTEPPETHSRAAPSPEHKRQWPDSPAKEAYYGLAGEIVSLVEEHSEADPVALLIQNIVIFGSVIGRGPHFIAEADRHGTNLFCVIVANTSKGRKGSAWGQAVRPYRELDPEWATSRVLSGLSSGEGLIWSVRDKIVKQEAIRDGKQITGYQEVEVDAGITDKRVLAFEPEFASVLQVLRREGNTLSALVRQSWDTGNLRTLTKNAPAVATDAHISVVGHITRDELRTQIDDTSLGNGFCNRILWVCARRSKYLADDEDRKLDDTRLAPIIKKLSRAITFARNVGEMRRDDAAKAGWRAVYRELSSGAPGLLGAVTSRSEAQVMRLACIYALLDLSESIGYEHLKAALALWEYCENSAKFIFGDALGNPVADTILGSLRRSRHGLSRTEIASLLGRNKPVSQVNMALEVLLENGLAEPKTEETEGRPRERWVAL